MCHTPCPSSCVERSLRKQPSLSASGCTVGPALALSQQMQLSSNVQCRPCRTHSDRAGSMGRAEGTAPPAGHRAGCRRDLCCCYKAAGSALVHLPPSRSALSQPSRSRASTRKKRTSRLGIKRVQCTCAPVLLGCKDMIAHVQAAAASPLPFARCPACRCRPFCCRRCRRRRLLLALQRWRAERLDHSLVRLDVGPLQQVDAGGD